MPRFTKRECYALVMAAGSKLSDPEGDYGEPVWFMDALKSAKQKLDPTVPTRQEMLAGQKIVRGDSE